ncbi:MAG: redoxin family protein [Terriglobales bacterium]
MRTSIVSLVADVFAGVAALLLFFLADGYVHVAADLRMAVAGLAVLYLAAGILRGRGRPENIWLKGLSVSSGGSLAMLILLWNQLLHLEIAVLLLVVNLAAICGVQVRRLWAARSRVRAGLVFFVPLGVLVVAALTIVPTLSTRIASQEVSAPAPAFSINRFDGTEVSSAELRGRVVVLDFWASWCPACRREMPELEKLYRRYQGDSRVSFWAVDMQKDGETPEKGRAFMQNAGYTLPIALGHEERLTGLQMEGFPSLIIIDAAGRIRLVHTGYDRSEKFQEELGKEIDKLL